MFRNAMRHHFRLPALLLAALLVAGFDACSDSTTSSNAGVDAVVRYTDEEGGCWTINVDPNLVYEPVNLPAEFQKDGLAVRVELKQRPDMAGFCQMAPIVQILSIRAR